ncbi:Chromosome partition protein Smc [bacterium HR15]|nr:Chromosome partition protein Smc [bacterium HR15]
MARTLTQIRIHGFKTFAQRVEIELTHDLVAVVGPNGCGKSNLVDAIVWALGEVSVRALRATTPTEVLFSGSATEKPLGMAEVTLWFDNESRWLPLDTNEVQITRRLYRSGEWECWINRTPARLRDVADLFAGTGLGRGGYAIVGQGEIEAFLSADPEERRRWLEELAGIAFYRNRRRDTLRDLEATRLHLQRIEDVLRELIRQREPLREQAERALAYRELQQQLHAMERQLLLHDFAQLSHQLSIVHQERAHLRQAIEEGRGAMQAAEMQAETHGKVVAHLDAEMDTLRTILQSQLSAEQRLQGDLKALSERERTLQELAQALHEEAGTLQEQEARHSRTVHLLQARLQTARAALQQLLPRLQAARETLQQHEQARQEVDARYHAALHAYAQREQQERERLALQSRLQELDELEPTIRARLQQTEAALLAAQKQEQQLHRELETAQAESDRLDKQLTAHQAQTATRQSLLAKLTAQVQALEASLQAGEGASPAVRRLLQAIQRGELQGEFYPVGAILTIPPELQLAIEAALGSSVNDIITPTEAEARAAIEWLKRNQAGRLTFLPLDILTPAPAPRLAPQQANGILGLAAELVRYDPRFERAVQHLLGRTVVIDTLENAIQWRMANGGRERMVTLEGELIQPSGAITGGRQGTERRGLLALKRQLDDARLALQQVQQQVQTDETALQSLRQRRETAKTRIEALQSELHEAMQQRLLAETEHSRVEQALAQLLHERKSLTEQLAQLDIQLAQQPLPDLTALQAERDQIQHAYAESVQALATLQAEQERLQREIEETTARLQSEQQQLQQVQQRLHHRHERMQAIQREYDQIQTRRAQLQQERETLLAQIEHAQARLEQLRAERQQQLTQSLQWSEQARQLRQQLQQMNERDRALELQSARIEVRLAELSEQWQRLFPDEPKLEGKLSIGNPPSRSAVEKVRRALQAMGEVNLGAAEEYARLTERIDTLTQQRDDLLKTCEQLEHALHEIDMHARQRFEETFEAVRVAFNERFQQLFEGGHADLILTQPRDPLSAGVLIEAQPPGKRRQRLELLSGGERALTATALLLAFMQVKPSPLCVLDEVDAALDGRNVQRFADHLKQMAQNTQVLIVTHNPITTAVAGQWIGVSMTGGVSRIVPYVPRLSDSETDGLDVRRAAIHLQSQPTPAPTTQPITQPPTTSDG